MDILQRMPWMAQDAVFKKLSEIAEVASLDKEERRKYDESLRHYRDTIIVMEGQYLCPLMYLLSSNAIQHWATCGN